MLIRRDEHHIDKVFRKGLHGAEETAPPHLWEGVRKNIRRRRKPLFWWWSAAAMTIGIAALFIGSELSSGETTIANAAHQWSGPSDRSIVSGIGEQIVSPADSEEIHVDQAASVQESLARGYHPIRSVVTTAEVMSKSVDQYPVRTSSKDKSTIPEITAADNSQPEINYPGSVIESDFSNVALPVRPGINYDAVSAEPMAESLALSQPARVELESEVMEDASLPIIAAANLRPAPKENGRFIVGAYYGVASPRRIASKNASSEFAAFNDRTHPGKERMMGLAFGYRVWKGLSVMSGIETSSFTENHEWIDTTSATIYNYNVTYDVTYPIDENTPVITMLVDSTAEISHQTERDFHKNTYTSLNIPLLITWQQPLFRRLSLTGEFGPVFRIDRSYVGSFVIGNGESYAAESLAADAPSFSGKDYIYLNQYYASWKTDLQAGLALGWLTDSGLGIRVGAQQRIMMKDSGNSSAISHRIIRPGWNVGIMYRF